jgi:long-subunit acyl-CoA synthetase (AMP-forming)
MTQMASTEVQSVPLQHKGGARTIAEAFRETVERRSDHVAVRTKDDEISLTWAQLRDRVDALAGGLAKLGVKRGDTVALMFGNRPEFHIADLAVMTLGATPFSIYATNSPEQIAYVVGDAQAKVALAEEALLANFVKARADLPQLEHLIVLEGERGEGTTAWADVEGADPSFDSEPHWRAVEPEDLLTLIYTSGTTGPPKGVQLVHRNMVTATHSIRDMIEFPEGARVISWLPNAHIAERAAHHYIPIVYGLEITTCPDPRQIAAFLPAVRPQWFFAVPRIWEKLKSGLEAMLAGLEGEAGEKAKAALDAAKQKIELEQAGQPVPDALASAVAAADEQMFAPLRQNLGLDQVAAVNVGAAPTPREVLVFFHAIGIEVAELWGMSETCGSGCCNRPGQVRIGSVGPPAPGVELKLAEDGELLMRSDVVMTGYRNLPEQTAEALDAEGWLHTGRHRPDRRGRLRDARRSQEGADDLLGRQEHVAGQHRVRAQGILPAHRPGVRDRRRPAVQHGADRPGRRLRPGVRGQAGSRGQVARGARRRRADAGGGPAGRGCRQRQARPGGADQEVPPGARGLVAGRRGAHSDDEAQAQADRAEVPRRDRGDVLGVGVAWNPEASMRRGRS